MSRAITILNYSSENIASRSLTPPSNAGSNEAALATQVERINRVIEKASFCSSTIARGLSAASEAFANTDDQEAASIKTVGEYLNARGPR